MHRGRVRDDRFLLAAFHLSSLLVAFSLCMTMNAPGVEVSSVGAGETVRGGGLRPLGWSAGSEE